MYVYDTTISCCEANLYLFQYISWTSYVTMLREVVRAIDCTQCTQISIIRASNFVLDFKLKKSYPLVKSNVRLGTKKKL